jgi:hypothetical protein
MSGRREIIIRRDHGTRIWVPCDKVIRTIVAILIIVAYLMGMLPGIAGCCSSSADQLLSSVVSGYCPLYTKIGVNTNR